MKKYVDLNDTKYLIDRIKKESVEKGTIVTM